MSVKNTSSKPPSANVPAPVPADGAACAGTVKVHESVLASITRKAVCAVPGVLRLSGSSFIDNIAEIVGSRRTFDRAIVIEMGDNSVAIEVHIVVRYGDHIPSVASAVQSAVIEDIARITGMSTSSVNVVVMDLDDETQPEGAADNAN